MTEILIGSKIKDRLAFLGSKFICCNPSNLNEVQQPPRPSIQEQATCKSLGSYPSSWSYEASDHGIAARASWAEAEAENLAVRAAAGDPALARRPTQLQGHIITVGRTCCFKGCDEKASAGQCPGVALTISTLHGSGATGPQLNIRSRYVKSLLIL